MRSLLGISGQHNILCLIPLPVEVFMTSKTLKAVLHQKQNTTTSKHQKHRWKSHWNDYSEMGCGQQCVHLHRDLSLWLQAQSLRSFSLSAHEGAEGQKCFEAAPTIKLPCSMWSLLDLWVVSGFMITCPAWCQTCQLIDGCQRSLGMAPSSFSDGETKLNLLWKNLSPKMRPLLQDP